MLRILISVVLLIFIVPWLLRDRGFAVVVLSFLVCIDILEDTAIFHGVVSLRLDLTWSL